MRIVIVEDDVRSREGLHRMMGRIDKDYVVVGEAKNGVEGFALIKRLRPDLVIIDICLAEMNGLEMLAMLQQSGVYTKVVIISAYSHFAFAQQAIRLGVDEYLLKPVTVAELSDTLAAMAKKLKNESGKNAVSYPKTLDSLENIFLSLLLMNITIGVPLRDFLQNKYAIDADGAFIMIPVYLGDSYEERHCDMAQQLNGYLQDIPAGRFCIVKLPSENYLLLLLYAFKDPNKLKCWFQTFVFQSFQKENNPVVFGWEPLPRLGEIKSKWILIQNSMEWSLVLGAGTIISSETVSSIATIPLMYPIEIEKKMGSAICAGDNKKIRDIVKEFLAIFSQGKVFAPNCIKETVKRFLFSIIALVREIEPRQYNILKPLRLIEMVNNIVTPYELEALFKRLLIVLLCKEEMQNETVVGLIVQRARGLAQEFYPTGITLDEIAFQLSVSPEYLSTQFKKEMGINFNTYIKGLRIDMAKELLIGTDLRLYEIAERIGYSSPKYFSHIFREVTGRLPIEYRKLHR